MQQIHKPALPGLVKVFLIFSYGWAVSLVLACACLIGAYFFARYTFGGETLLGTMLFAGTALCAIFTIRSIHTRSTSAPGLCRLLCLLLTVLYALLAFRMLIPVIGAGGRTQLGGYASFLMLIPAMLAAFIPFFMGWFRYFGLSPRISETFGIFSPGDAAPNLPPLGIGLLQVMCGMAVTGNVAAFLLMSVALGRGSGELLVSFLLVLLPGILFPLTLFAIVKKPGAKAMTVSYLLWAWAFFSAFTNAGSLSMIAMEYNMGMSALINFLWLLKMIPFPVITLAVFAAALSWRFISAPEEGAWLRQPSQQGRALYARLPLAAFIILYILFSYGSVFSISPVHGLVGICLAGAGLWAASTRLNTDIAYRNQRNSSMAILILFAVLLLFSVGARFMGRQEILRHTLLYISGDILRAGVCAYAAVVLSKERIGRHSPFAMPLPAGAFYLFCICSLIGGCLTLAMLGYASLAGLSQDGVYHNGVEVSLLLFRPGFWLGAFVFPGITLFLFTKRVPNVVALVAVCIVWLLSSGVAEIVLLAGVWQGAGGMGFANPKWLVLSTVLPLFAAYALNSKEFALWRRPKPPIGSAVPPVS